jgi:HemY protein
MKWKIALLVAIVIGAIGGSWIKNLPGFVIIAFDKTSYEMRLWVAITFLLILITSLYLIGRFLRGLLSGASKVKGWRGGRKWQKARKQTVQGMIAFVEGRWDQSEKTMVAAAENSETKLINYLVAAESAQYQNAIDRRDHYLQLAHRAEPSAKIAIGVTQAQLQQENNQYERALATLNELNSNHVNHPLIVKLLYITHDVLQDWQAVVDLLPQLKKLKIVSAERLQEIEFSSISQLLKNQLLENPSLNNNLVKPNMLETDSLASNLPEQQQREPDGNTKKIESLTHTWLNLPSAIRKKNKNILSYAELLVELEDMDAAEKLITPLFKKEVSEQMIRLYGNINSKSIDQQFSLLENWYNKHNDASNSIYAALGEIAYNASLWGKARFYFERSLRSNPSAEAYLMMAETLQKMDDEELADDTYRKGLEFVVQPRSAMQSLAHKKNVRDQQSVNILPKFENNSKS